MTVKYYPALYDAAAIPYTVSVHQFYKTHGAQQPHY